MPIPEGKHPEMTGLDEEAVAIGIEHESRDIEGTTCVFEVFGLICTSKDATCLCLQNLLTLVKLQPHCPQSNPLIQR